jgi:outer membrane biosynthesis protein TonB
MDAPSFQSLPRHQRLTVNLAVLIGADGRVQKIESLSEANAISQAALEAAMKLTYGPATPNTPLTETWLMVDVMSN